MARGDPDPSFPGNGTLRCLVCDEPVITHRIGPCPKLNVRVIRGVGTFRSESVEARKRRQSRARHR